MITRREVVFGIVGVVSVSALGYLIYRHEQTVAADNAAAAAQAQEDQAAQQESALAVTPSGIDAGTGTVQAAVFTPSTASSASSTDTTNDTSILSDGDIQSLTASLFDSITKGHNGTQAPLATIAPAHVSELVPTDAIIQGYVNSNILTATQNQAQTPVVQPNAPAKTQPTVQGVPPASHDSGSGILSSKLMSPVKRLGSQVINGLVN